MIFHLYLGENDNLAFRIYQKALAHVFPGESLISISKRDIIQHLSVNDVISRLGTHTSSWELFGQSFSPLEARTCFNNLSSFQPTDFDTETDHSAFLSSEYNAYILFQLSRIPNVLFPPVMGNIEGYGRSLIWQWRAISKLSGEHFKIPAWYFGRNPESFFTQRQISEICHNINPFNIFNWRASKIQAADTSGLYYEIPNGLPVFTTFHYNEIVASTIGRDLFTKTQKQAVIELAMKLGVETFQILIFHDEHENESTFGCLAPRPDFSQFTSAQLIDTFQFILKDVI